MKGHKHVSKYAFSLCTIKLFQNFEMYSDNSTTTFNFGNNEAHRMLFIVPHIAKNERVSFYKHMGRFEFIGDVAKLSTVVSYYVQ